MIRIALLGTAHVHAPSFAACLLENSKAQLVGIYDRDESRGQKFADERQLKCFPLDELLDQCDAAVVCSENMMHADLIEAAAVRGKGVLCEKPVAPSVEHINRIRVAVQKSQAPLMTAFPCPFSPAFERLLARIQAGEIGRVLAVNSTNRGKCPFGWFVDSALSGGGAMIDHVVHVTDLLRRIFQTDPVKVTAQIGNNMYSEPWDDTAHLTIDFPSGVFATLDSSWSRPQNYKTWGDVTLKVIGEMGVIEVDLFGQGLSLLTDRYAMAGTASNLDALMVDEFLSAMAESRLPKITLEDGLHASMVAIAGYTSAQTKRAVSLN